MVIIAKQFKIKLIRLVMAGFLLLTIALLGLTGCSSFKKYVTKSLWPERQIVIDGKSDDWSGALSFIEKEQLSLGFYNDQDNLYLCLIAEGNFTRAQILRGGLTVWFDPQGGNEKKFGIRYPLGAPSREMRVPPEMENPQEMNEGFPGEAMKELEIIRSNKEEPERMEVAKAKENGLEVVVAPSSGLLVYELKIPLLIKEEQPLAVGAKPGATIGIGFETSQPDLSRMRRGGMGGTPGGGMGRPGMGGGFGRGRGGFGMGFNMPGPLKIWTTVQLASGASGSALKEAPLVSISNGRN
jgi:hypothetical protein